MNGGAGSDVGPYRLLRELGRGAQGVVWLAEDGRVPRKVALKILDAARATEADLARLKREAEVLASLSHPGLRTILDVGTADGRAYVAFPYLEGETLAAKLDRRRPGGRRDRRDAKVDDSVAETRDENDARTIDDAATEEDATPQSRIEIAETLALFAKVARAVHAAHEAGVVHRDLKPANIFVERNGEPVVLDFGLARETNDDLSLTRSGDVPGTPAYVAPERLSSPEDRLDRRVDVWSLGVSLFECVAGRRPFGGAGREAAFRSVLYDATPDVRRFNREAPADLRSVVDVALEKDPNRRYATAAAFADDLDRLREGRPVSAKPLSAIGRAARFAARRPALAALILAAALAPATGAVFRTLREADLPLVLEEEARRRQAARDRRIADAFQLMHDGRRPEALAAFEAIEREDGASSETDAGIALIAFDDAVFAPERATMRGERIAAHAKRIAERGDAPYAAAALAADAARLLGRAEEADALLRDAPEPIDALGYFVRARRALPRRVSIDGARFRPALEDCERALLASPRPRAEIYALYAYAAGRANDAAAARRAAEALLLYWPDSPGARLSAALGLALAGADAEAAPLYAALIEDHPGHSSSSVNYAATLGDLGRSEEAVSVMAAETRRRPNDAETFDNYARHLAAARRYDEALAAHDRSLELGSGAAEFLRSKVRTLVEAGRAKEAVPIAREVVALDPKDHEAHYALGAALRASGRVREAVAPFEAAAAIEPRSGSVKDALAQAYLATGRVDDAFRTADEAIALDPKTVNAFAIRGALRVDRRDFEGAVSDLRAAIKIRPSHAAARYQLADALRRFRKEKEAVDGYADVPRNHAAYPLARLKRGELLLVFGRFDEALADAVAAEEAASRASKSETRYLARRLRAVAAECVGRPADASAALAALKADETATAYDAAAFGTEYMGAGRSDVADAAFRVALKLDPDEAPALVNRAVVAWFHGRFDEALEFATAGQEAAERATTRRFKEDVRRKDSFAKSLATAARILKADDPTTAPDAPLSIALRALEGAGRPFDALRVWKAADASLREPDEEGVAFVAANCAAKIAATAPDAAARDAALRDAFEILEFGRSESMRLARAGKLGARNLRRFLRSVERDPLFAPLREATSGTTFDDAATAESRRALWSAIAEDARTLELFLDDADAKASSRPAK
jgi:serine/threonine protein kinase/predicted Zn-dependent protease